MTTAFALWIVLPLLLAAAALASVRAFVGPTSADRVVALDLLAVVGIGILATEALATGEWEYLDVAIVLGLVGFLGTVAFARYLERRVSG